jgi:hypothetical protein
MKRTTIFLTEGQIKRLEKIAARKTAGGVSKVTVAQLVRQAVENFLKGEK